MASTSSGNNQPSEIAAEPAHHHHQHQHQSTSAPVNASNIHQVDVNEHLLENIEGHDHSHKSIDPDELIRSDDPEHPANLICELCREFYKLGWVTGTGGGISIRKDEHVYLAPSGVQKERIKPEHIFVLPFAQSSVPKPGSLRDFLRVPTTKGLKESACTPLFWNAFTMRAAGACIHTHSQHAVLLTLLLPRDAKSFRISHQEMIKGVRIGGVGKTLKFYDTLEIPIIENTADEEDLTFGMADAMEKFPEAAAILVRRHGVYVWGPTWEQAKTQAECLDYLFEIATKMLLAKIPLVGEE